jgi:hypothetical protein
MPLVFWIQTGTLLKYRWRETLSHTANTSFALVIGPRATLLLPASPGVGDLARRYYLSS